MTLSYFLCRVAYRATVSDPTTRDRRLRDFPASTPAVAESNARRWADTHNAQRTAAERADFPLVVERWNASTRTWDVITQV